MHPSAPSPPGAAGRKSTYGCTRAPGHSESHHRTRCARARSRRVSGHAKVAPPQLISSPGPPRPYPRQPRPCRPCPSRHDPSPRCPRSEERREGTRVSVRVDLGVRRHLKKKKIIKKYNKRTYIRIKDTTHNIKT